MEQTKTKTFGYLVVERAWSSAWKFFGSWKHDASVATVSIIFGEWSYYKDHGLPASLQDGVYNALHLAAPAAIIFILLFLWNFWLAPSAIVYEKLNAAGLLQEQASKTLPKVLFIDEGTTDLAGKLRHLGEVVRKPDFTGFTVSTVNWLDWNDVINSTHVIWTKPNANQLRRDLENRVGRIIAAHKEHSAKEARAAIAEMDSIIDGLTKILLGAD
ncbi:MAG TPA: hypothetical protein VHW02_12240 [Rhizomicrobium sp.]|jgi:hypothetical protein|nr:hypothetical protein [Rhizomicrobium sp.]